MAATENGIYVNQLSEEMKNLNDLLFAHKCNGIMGVPITFMDKYNANQFQIIGATESEGKGFSNGLWIGGIAQAIINGERVYKRLFIRSKKEGVNS